MKMPGVLTQYHVKTAYQHKFLEVLSGYVACSLRAAGNIMAEAYYERGDPCILWIIERWSHPTYYKKNKRSGAAKVIGALTKTGLVSPVEIIFIKDLEMLSKESSGHASMAGDQPLTIMLLVAVRAGKEDDFVLMNHLLMPVFRNEPGLLIFQLCQVVHHKTRFIVYKRFRNQDAFQYHLKDPALKPMIKFLQTSVKESPFEKGYHHLIQFAPL